VSGEESLNHGHAEANGIRVHYVRQGLGTPLVLLHGWPEFWFVWRKNIPALAERFDVIAPDLRGFGESESRRCPSRPADTRRAGRGLAGSRRRPGIERFGIVSHDVGSFVAQRFAARYPERVLGLFFLIASIRGSDAGGWSRRA
jgi:pimeloyl-ACP methyl ester carboxylesterase